MGDLHIATSKNQENRFSIRNSSYTAALLIYFRLFTRGGTVISARYYYIILLMNECMNEND